MLGGAVGVGRLGQSVGAGRHRAPVDLVGDDRIGEPERVAVLQLGALEDPVLGAMHRVGARGARDPEPVARVPAARERQPDRLRLRASDEPIATTDRSACARASVASTGSSLDPYLKHVIVPAS